MIKIKLSDIVQPGRPADVGQLERAIVAACKAEKEKETNGGGNAEKNKI